MGLFSFMFGSQAAESAKPPKSAISLQQLEDMFANMRANTKWNLDGELLWGYFFTDPDAKRLEPLSKYLSADGYHVVAIYPTDDRSTNVLHVERVEHLTPNTLDVRNQEFEALAKKFEIATYDGMDAGPALTGSH